MTSRQEAYRLGVNERRAISTCRSARGSTRNRKPHFPEDPHGKRTPEEPFRRRESETGGSRTIRGLPARRNRRLIRSFRPRLIGRSRMRTETSSPSRVQFTSASRFARGAPWSLRRTTLVDTHSVHATTIRWQQLPVVDQENLTQHEDSVVLNDTDVQPRCTNTPTGTD